MRTLTIPAALLLTTVFAMGCGDQKAPTGPSEVEIGPQFNSAPVVFTFPFSFPDFNPCTGLVHTISGEITLKEHVIGNGQNFHVNNRAQFDVTTSDGFSGSAVEHFTLNDNNAFNATDVLNVNLSNDSGQRIKIHLLFHVTVTASNGLTVFINNSSSKCVGKPAA